MQAAASMLLKGQDNITIITGTVGYENSGKFAGTFKNVMYVSFSVTEFCID
jgi:YesN/AraC family two-component response regulator